MAVLPALMLQILALLQPSHSIPLPHQFTEIPEVFIPASLLSTGYGINLPKKYSQIFPILTKSETAQPVVTSFQEFAASTQGAKNQLQQLLEAGIISELVGFGGEKQTSQPLSIAAYYNTGESSSSSLQKASSMNPFVQMTKPEFQQLPLSTILQQAIPSSVLITKSVNETFPNLNLNYIQPAVRPNVQFANIADNNVVATAPITLHNIASSTATPSTFTNTYSLGNNIQNGGLYQYPAVLNGFHLPKYGGLGALLQLQNSGASSSPGTGIPAIINDAATSGASGVQQTQIIQLPCTLHIPSSVPITLNPGTSASQVAAVQQIQQSGIPSSFIDDSPPTIAILRPPTSSEMTMDSSIAPITAPAALSTFIHEPTNKQFMIDPKVTSPSLVATTITQQNARSQDSQDVRAQNDEVASEDESGTKPEVARNGIPFVYAMLPASSLPPSFVSSPPVGLQSKSNTKNKSSPTTPRPSKGNNPFFNVNKRKHFEYYQYF